MATKSTIHISQAKMKLALVDNSKYEAFARRIGEEIRAAAIAIFVSQDIKTNEQRVSEYTPPKYLASFRLSYIRKTAQLRVENTDPGWALVEFGSHPGGNAAAFVPAYKPLRRAILVVAARRGV